MDMDMTITPSGNLTAPYRIQPPVGVVVWAAGPLDVDCPIPHHATAAALMTTTPSGNLTSPDQFRRLRDHPTAAVDATAFGTPATSTLDPSGNLWSKRNLAGLVGDDVRPDAADLMLEPAR